MPTTIVTPIVIATQTVTPTTILTITHTLKNTAETISTQPVIITQLTPAKLTTRTIPTLTLMTHIYIRQTTCTMSSRMTTTTTTPMFMAMTTTKTAMFTHILFSRKTQDHMKEVSLH